MADIPLRWFFVRRWMDEIRDSGRALDALTAGMP
jgi:hypothetical protein